MTNCQKCGAPIYKGMKICTCCKADVSGFESKPVYKEEKNELHQSQYQGLGGWLVLVGIGLFLTVGSQRFGIYQSLSLFIDGTVYILSTPGSGAYIAGYTNALYFELVAEIVFLLGAVYLIRLYFKKDKRFPNYYMIFLGSFVVFIIIDCIILSLFSSSSLEIQQFLDELLSEQTMEIFQIIVSTIIWCSYMKVSKRVKATFIEDSQISFL